ncbi:MAG: ribonuclease J [bacterium]
MELKLVALGGLGEIGKNMMALEMSGTMLLIDAGVKFPDEKTPGVDLILPDFTYLLANQKRIAGIILTHGHEDHVGAVPYLLQQLSVPVYGTDITLGLTAGRAKELGVKMDLHTVKPGDRLPFGPFQVELLPVTHSVPGGLGLAIRTPLGMIVHSGDFKFDKTPVGGKPFDFERFAKITADGVLCLLCDSTNAEKPGFASSERTVKPGLERIFEKARNRIIVTTFASNVHRIQQIIETAALFNRKVAIDGMSMTRVVNTAQELGYLNIPEGQLIKVEDLSLFPRDQLVIITTGSQGEPLSALSRIATGEHRKIKIEAGDTVIFSADPIPGNERLVSETINNLFRLKAEVIYGTQAGVHVSGHAFREDIKTMLQISRPRYFIPIHGEYRHLVWSSRLAQEMGIRQENVLLLENGDMVSFTPGRAYVQGKVASAPNFVDGICIDEVKSEVIEDRRALAQEGVLVVAAVVSLDARKIFSGPLFITRGLLQEKDWLVWKILLHDQITALLRKMIEEEGGATHASPLLRIEEKIQEQTERFLAKRLKRRPLVLVSVLEGGGPILPSSQRNHAQKLKEELGGATHASPHLAVAPKADSPPLLLGKAAPGTPTAGKGKMRAGRTSTKVAKGKGEKRQTEKRVSQRKAGVKAEERLHGHTVTNEKKNK